MPSTKLLMRAWPPVAWATFIFALSSISILPSHQINLWDFVFKKSAHVFVYAVLFLLTLRALNTGKLHLKHYLAAFVIGFLYALSDEFHQTFTPGRTGTIRDVGFDTVGLIIAWIIAKKHHEKDSDSS